DLTFRYEELPIGSIYCDGRAEIGYSSDGSWSIDSIIVESAQDMDGNNRTGDRSLTDAALRDALDAYRSASIDSEVREAIYWRDGAADRGCWAFHQTRAS